MTPPLPSLDHISPFDYVLNTQITPVAHTFTLPRRVVHSQGEEHFPLWPRHTHTINKQKSGSDCESISPSRRLKLPSCPLPLNPPQPSMHTQNKTINKYKNEKKSTQSAAPLHFKDNGQNSSHFLKCGIATPHPHLLIVIKFGLIFSFSHLSSPSVWCNSSLSHSLPHHPSLSLGSSEPLTSDPQAGSPAGQEPGGGRRGERRGGWKVCYWGMPASSFGHGYSLHCCCHSNWTRRQREQTAESCWDGALSSVIWL